ncbi:Methyltransferase domain-containing protein [Paenibacillus uliginis N3/975]|uniref:site-specific DNA-methyltransferase (adenine-specific) n=1 Tax=Paenibacillus uliginis N3/975 TaxID=1313296 RepID=A0A1X7HP40_9BACL|nr:BREX-1 system adenine-specific DNA-methyltransferase PglX [Paenibacillus uliginis]SMF90208.1 Methyltransferase domain-containing protein [Paenibacillus uliginis N3/975]
MNKTALKKFATNARKELIEKVKAKAFRIGITEESFKKAQFESSDAIYIDGKQLSATEKKQREKLISRINEIGYQQVVEEVSYTWFNRFTALRFMEVNNYLPTKVRVLSSNNPGSSEPDIITEALTVDLDIDKELVYEMKLSNMTEELFKYLVIKQCNSLNRILPFMFETIDDYKEILFPESLLMKDSFLRNMSNTDIIPETDWEQVEIIGWLYQFYISDQKDKVYKETGRHKKEEIPCVTQLFTPDWIVKYMVQNSLGRYWVESHPEDRDLTSNWEYYFKNDNSRNQFNEMLAPYIDKQLRVEDIKCLDPAMGSGHILVYLFEVFFEIYSKCGYMEREIPKLIIENNLYGLDIDDRAYQLACFSIIMKALKYNSRFLRTIEREGVTLNLVSLQETNCFNKFDIAYFANEKAGDRFDKTSSFIEQFRDAKIYGSLLKIDPIDSQFFKDRLDDIINHPAEYLDQIESRDKIIMYFKDLITQAEIMSQQYEVVITNPPYMGSRRMNEKLVKLLNDKYADSKTDTCTAFMEMEYYLKPNGFLTMINQHSWMFTSSFERLREKLVRTKTIYSMIHLGAGAFEEIGGEVVQSTAFVLRNNAIKGFKGDYIRLVDYRESREKELKTIEAAKDSNAKDRFFGDINTFTRILERPIAYWISDDLLKAFIKSTPIGEIAEPKAGLSTGDNTYFQKEWFEVEFAKIGFNYQDIRETENGLHKWFPCNSGGAYRKWYGNNEVVVNWEHNGQEIRNFKTENGKLRSAPRNTDWFFKEGLTWTKISSGNFAVRYKEVGFIFDDTGRSAFSEDPRLNKIIIGLFCSKLSFEVLKILNPTMSFTNGDIYRIPFMNDARTIYGEDIVRLVDANIEISKNEWDSFETSWNFNRHPFLNAGSEISYIKDAYNEWSKLNSQWISDMKYNEEKLNAIFTDIYGVQNEITPNLEESDVTLRKADKDKDIRSLISYILGCVFGRYSLNKEGIAFAGGKFVPDRYQSFSVDKDNILPILSGAYFEDDIVSRLLDFVRAAYGEESLVENLEYIADSLGQKDGETAKETIQRYFLNDFFKDHLQTYKKKPIYWLFTSGKQKAFNCLIYMHRYDKSTLSRIRTDYLHELQLRMDAKKKSLLDIINGDSTSKEISNAKKELKTLDLKIEELRAYDEKLHHMADMQIEIDLDEGVAVNYAKFEGLLAPIK